MAKHINADELFTKLDTIGNPNSEFATDDYIDGFSDGISDAMKEVMTMPSADVAALVSIVADFSSHVAVKPVLLTATGPSAFSAVILISFTRHCAVSSLGAIKRTMTWSLSLAERVTSLVLYIHQLAAPL